MSACSRPTLPTNCGILTEVRNPFVVHPVVLAVLAIVSVQFGDAIAGSVVIAYAGAVATTPRLPLIAAEAAPPLE